MYDAITWSECRTVRRSCSLAAWLPGCLAVPAPPQLLPPPHSAAAATAAGCRAVFAVGVVLAMLVAYGLGANVSVVCSS
jgi:hypothetical protein